MKKSLLALPALVILLGAGVTASVYASDFGQMQNLTEDQQASLEQVKELVDAGKFDEAKQVAEAAGLPNLKHGHRMGGPNQEQREALDAALTNNDYDAFVTLTADAPFADELTPEIFAKLVEAHTLMEAGDMDGAKELLSSLDLPLPIPGVGPMGRPEGGRHDAHQAWMEELTDEQKNLLEQAHTLRENGDEEGARAILDSLDLPQPPVRAFRMHERSGRDEVTDEVVTE